MISSLFFKRCAPSVAASSVRAFSASTHVDAKVGFFGLGNMGAGMAANLLKKGHHVYGYDLNPSAMEKLSGEGMVALKSVEALEECDADVVITMLPNASHVKSVLDVVLPKSKKGTLFIDSSTIAPGAAVEHANEAEKHGCIMIDAPVSGGVNGANAGTLTFMVGGKEEAVERARPYLECMGKNIVSCGANGTGQVVKLCNNLSLAIQMIGISESMNMGIKYGMDPKKLASIFNTSTARCFSGDSYNPVPGVLDNTPASNDYKGGFGSALMLKDLGLAVKAAEEAGVSIPLGSLSHQIYQLLADGGLGGKDFSVTYQWLKDQNGKDHIIKTNESGCHINKANVKK